MPDFNDENKIDRWKMRLQIANLIWTVTMGIVTFVSVFLIIVVLVNHWKMVETNVRNTCLAVNTPDKCPKTSSIGWFEI